MSIFGILNNFLREQGLLGEGLSKKRTLKGVSGFVFKLFGAGFSLFFLYTTFFGLISQETHVGFYFLGTFILSFMLFGARSRAILDDPFSCGGPGGDETAMKQRKEKTEEQSFPKDLPIFDPENPPYQVQHLCVYLRELDEEAEERGSQ